MLGLIATRSIDKTMPGIKDLVAHAEQWIRTGLTAYDALEKCPHNPATPSSERGSMLPPPILAMRCS
jgi:cytochrome d ubiquinol oxidase subunit I